VNGLLGELKTVFGQSKTLINDRTKAVAQLTEHEDLFIWPEFTVDQEKDVLTAIDREKAQQKQFGDAQRKSKRPKSTD